MHTKYNDANLKRECANGQHFGAGIVDRRIRLKAFWVDEGNVGFLA